ncbi:MULTISPECIES: DUF4124 domain-containing protein [Legionella]|uniref:DUF4124 domain-containing protein n=1 Tax=Legionella TaxID=445 RepID=UPI000F8DE031|nr:MULTISPECIES: DUF4124 domain-containing protein [Legionella]MCP0914010.1 DUF4124 domain-containing protein [Legionella sp. 27cVA30]RUQ95131.1 DUF4124 domain-containing protein [Legionella septentrionalis]RUR08894.1 DUF4124 domain-containing protein [Legionella septentrionalis]
MKKFLLFFTLILLASSLFAQIYKWTDSNGNVHFSDRPHPGAKKIDLPPVQTYSPPPVADETPEAPSTATLAPYTRIAITQPEDQATIRNNQGSIGVLVQVEPALRAGDKLQILFDGAALGQPQTTMAFELQNINRGSHTIAAQVLDAEGNVLITSESITIFMHRPRVGMVPATRRGP